MTVKTTKAHVTYNLRAALYTRFDLFHLLSAVQARNAKYEQGSQPTSTKDVWTDLKVNGMVSLDTGYRECSGTTYVANVKEEFIILFLGQDVVLPKQCIVPFKYGNS